ncbi:MAG: DNA repair protein RecO [bacterium]|nr:DNA repair protein RecO [bacterium]
MEILKVEGIVIGDTNYSESSKILKILTQEKGIISAMSKGCRNLKSKLRGVSAPFSYGTFHLYYKSEGISILVGVDIKNSFHNIMTDIEKISYATYLLDLTEQVHKNSNEGTIFSLLISTLEKIEEGYDISILTSILELKLLNFLGIRPVIDGCSICGNDKKIVTIDPTNGGYICQECYHNQKIYNAKTIQLIRMFYYVDISKITKLEVKSEIKQEINEFIEEYYDRYSGLYLKSKSFLKNLSKIG